MVWVYLVELRWFCAGLTFADLFCGGWCIVDFGCVAAGWVLYGGFLVVVCFVACGDFCVVYFCLWFGLLDLVCLLVAFFGCADLV